MRPQPARLLQGQAVHRGIQPGTGNTGKEGGARDLAFASVSRRNCDCMMRAPICGRSRRGPSGTKCRVSSDSAPASDCWRRLDRSRFQRLNRSQIDGSHDCRRWRRSAATPPAPSRTVSMPMEWAKSLALPMGTTSVGICFSANPPRWRWMVPSPPKISAASGWSVGSSSLPENRLTPGSSNRRTCARWRQVREGQRRAPRYFRTGAEIQKQSRSSTQLFAFWPAQAGVAGKGYDA